MSAWIEINRQDPKLDDGVLVEVCNEVGETLVTRTPLKRWDYILSYRVLPTVGEELTKTAPSPLEVQVGGDHYKKMKIQPLEYCHANNIGKIEGDAIAYVSRWRDKGGIEDLRKSIHELEILIELETRHG